MHPIRHLLFLNLLGLTAAEFFEDFEEYKPFGDGPFPCLNKAAKHYGKMIIKAPKVMDNLTKLREKQGLPFGIFHCDCKFIYQRLGPDQSKEDKFRYDSVRDYGGPWEKEFASLWADLNISTAEIGRRLGVSQTTVSRLAIRFDLPMNSPGTRTLEGYARHRNPRKLFYELREGYRKQWLKIRKDNPELNKKLLFEMENHLILWLTRYDSEWFEENRPEREIARNALRPVDWAKEDLELSNIVSNACDEIRAERDPMKRVWITEIIKRIGNKGWLDKRKEKLPRTTKMLEQKLESFEEFMLRKIEVFTKIYIEERTIPTELRFRIRAVLRNSTAANSEEINLAVRNAITEIKNSFVISTE
jgi:transcriptional regulator with XRE-family HTH domain